MRLWFRRKPPVSLKVRERPPDPWASPDQIRACASPWQIPDVFPKVFSPDLEVSGAAKETVARLVRSLPVGDHARLDILFRQITEGYRGYASGGLLLEPSHVERLLEGPPGSLVPLLGVCSFHRSGYVREASVKRLAERFTGEELPFLLLRINDWVEPVRERALRAVELRFTQEHARSLVQCLPLILRLKECGRAEHQDLPDRVQSFLSQPGQREALLEGTKAGDRGVRRTCVDWALRALEALPKDLVTQALGDEDLVIRMRTAEFLSLSQDVRGIEPFLETLKKDPCASVRMQALHALARRERFSELEGFLTDRNTSVRDTARYVLSRAGGAKFDEFYRSVIAKVASVPLSLTLPHEGGEDTRYDRLSPCGRDHREGGSEGPHPHPNLRAATLGCPYRGKGSAVAKTLAGAILGLSETGSKEDAALVASWVQDPRSSVARACLQALGRLDPDRYVDLFLASLAGPKPGLSRAAAEQLLHLTHRVPVHTIGQILMRPGPLHIKRSSLRVMGRYSKWSRLSYLLEACLLEEDEVRQRALDLLARWIRRYNAVQTVPAPSEVQSASTALSKAGSVLPPGLHDDLASMLASWG